MKKIKLLIISITMLLMFSGCDNSKLSDAYNKDEVIDRAATVVDILNEQNYDEIEKISSEVLKSLKVVDELKKVWIPTKDKIGEFEKIKKQTVVGNGEYATVAVMAKYKNGNVVFTMTFNELLELEGIFIK